MAPPPALCSRDLVPGLRGRHLAADCPQEGGHFAGDCGHHDDNRQHTDRDGFAGCHVRVWQLDEGGDPLVRSDPFQSGALAGGPEHRRSRD